MRVYASAIEMEPKMRIEPRQFRAGDERGKEKSEHLHVGSDATHKSLISVMAYVHGPAVRVVPVTWMVTRIRWSGFVAQVPMAPPPFTLIRPEPATP